MYTTTIYARQGSRRAAEVADTAEEAAGQHLRVAVLPYEGDLIAFELRRPQVLGHRRVEVHRLPERSQRGAPEVREAQGNAQHDPHEASPQLVVPARQAVQLPPVVQRAAVEELGQGLLAP